MPRTLVFTLALLGLSGLFDQPTRAQDKKAPAAVTPAPRDGNWTKRHDGFKEIAKKGGVDVLFLGDSITDAWRSYNPEPMRNGKRVAPQGGKRIFERDFEPMKAANFGISGDRTQHVLWRLQNGELDGIKPKVVMLMIGTNNANNDSAEDIAEGIKAIVKEIHKKSPETKVLLLGVFPRGEKPTPVRDKLKTVNDTVKKLDDGGKTVKYLDIGDKFLGEGGVISEDIMYDALHLTEKGYQIWADAVKEPIKDLLGKK